MGVFNKKGFVKASLLAGIIIILAILIFFSYSVFTPMVSSNGLIGEITGIDGSENGEFEEMTFSSPIFLGSQKLNGNGDDGTDGENDENGEDDDKVILTGGGFAPPTGGGGGGCVQCPPPTHTECDYENELCVTVEGEGENVCTTDADCYCDPRTPGYWKNHLENADLDCVHDNYDLFDDVTNQSEIHYVLECSGDCDNMTLKLKKFILTTILNICNNNFDLDDMYNGSIIEYWIDQSIYEFHNGNNTTKEYHKNALDDIVNGRGLECYPDEPDTHMECDYDGESCIEVLGEGDDECDTFEDCPQYTVCNYDRQECMLVEGEGDDECETYDDCFHTECDYEEEVCFTVASTGESECETDVDCEDECIPPYLAVDKTAIPDELCMGDETTITLTISGEGEICDGHYPVDVVLVFDNSGSMDDDGYDQNISDWQPIGDAKYAAMYFTDLLGTNDKAGLVSFNTEAKLEHSLTFDKTAVKNAINNMYAGGWTNMSQGIDFANQELIGNGRTEHPWIEVLLSDGNNNCGTDKPPADCHQRVFDRVQEAADNGIVIYTIALGEKANQTMMEKIANMTGGKFYYAPSSTDLDGIYEEIAGEIVTSAATDVVVIDYLPDYVELKNGTLPVDCEYDDVDRKITCEVDDIQINETIEFEFEVYVNQLGYNLTNIYPDSGVEYVNYNETTVFEEFPETYVTVIDCDHTECNYVDEICELVNEPGTDECVTFDDCEKHTVCDYQERTCEEVSGPGTDECETFNDCTHTECCGMSCIDVDSSGTDECSTDADCTDHVCNYDDFTCDAVAGSGIVECETFQDCPQYTVCDYIEQACVTVEGVGINQCSTYDDCFHTECNYDTLSCDTITSTGTSECNTFQDCPQHNVCDYVFEQCVTVEGEGQNECAIWEDCLACGDGIVTPPEQCELPGTQNNQYCGQNTWECLGNKYGVRDAYGDCSQVCGCLLDPFQYSCVEGKCGAQCDEDTDCDCPGDSCHHRYPNWLDYPEYSECSEEDCSCSDCEPEETICHPNCMGNCEVDVWTGHGMNPTWGYPYSATDDIYIVAQSNGQCDGWTVRIRYWWCSCPNNDPKQSAIEVTRDEFSAKYDRLCSANAAGTDNPTHSLQCSPCEWRDYRPEFPKDDGKKFWTGVGTSTGTFQIDLREYHDCYDRVSSLKNGKAVALACAAKSEDNPTHLECNNKMCQEVAGYGADQCNEDSDCYFYKCVDEACVKRKGTQADQCSTDADCVIQTHTECSSMACVDVTGSGTDQCNEDCDCYHMECSDKKCVQVTGDGQDTCSVDNNCYWYKCDYAQQACIKKAGTQADECSTFNDCETHNECIGFTCEPIPGPGFDECFSDWECEPMII